MEVWLVEAEPARWFLVTELTLIKRHGVWIKRFVFVESILFLWVNYRFAISRFGWLSVAAISVIIDGDVTLAIRSVVKFVARLGRSNNWFINWLDNWFINWLNNWFCCICWLSCIRVFS